MSYGRQISFEGWAYPTEFKAESFDLQFSPDGKAWMRFTVSAYGGKEKDRIKHNCVVFGQLAENIAESLKPGDEVVVIGDLQSNNYVSKRYTDSEGEAAQMYGTSVLCDMVGISLSSDTGTSNKMWTDKPGEADAKPETKKKGKKKGKKKADSPSEAPF